MAGITIPLNRFRKTNSPRPSANSLHERWGDTSISSPTGLPYTHTHPGHCPEPSASPRLAHRDDDDDDDDIIPLTGTRASRQSSPFTRHPLNPRRLSVRLKPSSSSSSPRPNTYNNNNNNPPLPESKQPHTAAHLQPHIVEDGVGGGRTEFIYKPIRRQDYSSVVAETAAAQNRSHPSQNHRHSRPASRYQYQCISSRARYTEEFMMLTSARADYARGEDVFDDNCDVNEEGSTMRRRMSFLSPRRLHLSPPPPSAAAPTPVAAKRRSRVPRLTTAMVPDAEEMYG